MPWSSSKSYNSATQPVWGLDLPLRFLAMGCITEGEDLITKESRANYNKPGSTILLLSDVA